jgi:hypothetical protein
MWSMKRGEGISAMGKVLLGLAMAALLLSGCDEDHRKPDEKLTSPSPDFNSRPVMACPKCGSPTSPFRISRLKAFYRCTGQPPRYPYHDERRWEHSVQVGNKDNTEQ